MATEERDRFKDVMNRLGESSSLHGIPKIITSRQVVVQILWCLLLMGAITLFCIQFRGLIQEFYSYPTKTSVTLQFTPLPMPAVTFCNMNPIKTGFALSRGPYSNITTLLEDEFLNTYLDKYDDESIFETKNFSQSDYREFNDSRDVFEAWKIRLMTEIRELDEEARQEAGHQLNDFIHSATFAGGRLPRGLFKMISSPKYGNCFTLDNQGIIARGSGHANSLHVVFNIESFEYLHHFSSAFGVRMVLHERGAHPLPDEEGIALSSNYETHIGIRLTKIKRLGDEYSECTNGDSFSKQYGVKYTVPICYSVCEAENILASCGCMLMSTELVSNKSARICDFDHFLEWECVYGVLGSIYKGNISCDCKSRCNVNVYSSTISGRVWPHAVYLEKVLVKEACKRANDTSEIFQSVCYYIADGRPLTSQMVDKLLTTFLSVYIYYEDLNHETITEEPLYNTVRFLSDICGALGLFLGASFLTMVELLQVLLEIVLHLRRKMKIVSPTKNTNVEIFDHDEKETKE